MKYFTSSQNITKPWPGLRVIEAIKPGTRCMKALKGIDRYINKNHQSFDLKDILIKYCTNKEHSQFQGERLKISRTCKSLRKVPGRLPFIYRPPDSRGICTRNILFLYIKGGITYSEMRIVHEINYMFEYEVDIVLLSDCILTPKIYIDNLANLCS